MKNKIYKHKKNMFEKRKIKKDDIYKKFLFIISFMIIGFIFFSILLIFSLAINGFIDFDNLNLSYFIFGNYYDGKFMFAAGFMILNTLWITFLASIIAIPISICTALFITKVVHKNFRSIFIVVISILSAIPTVIYGAFGMKIIDSVITSIFPFAIPGSILSIVLTLSFMIMPTITILSINSIETVDQKLEQSSLALGATRTQTSFKVTLKSASKGIFVSSVIGIGRALGEATAISMIASQTNYGPTFNIFGSIRLLTATMLQGFNETAPGTIERANMFAMASILIITIFAVVFSMKMIENNFDVKLKSQKSTKDIISKQNLIKKYHEEEELSKKEQKKINKWEKEKKSLNKKISLNKNYYLHKKITSKKSYNYDFTINSYKKRETNIKNTFLFIFTILGIFLLLAIFTFLFNGGFSVLNWEYLSTRGVYERVEIDGSFVTIYGLSTPIFGSFITIVSSLFFSIPIGVLIGILFSVYIKQNSKLGNFIKIGIDFLTGIPSLVYGVIGSILFIPLFSIIGLNFISSSIVMGIMTLPTIIKNTQVAIEKIEPSQSQGSLALGATKFITINKVLLLQSKTTIISSAVLASGIILADSAVFITMYGTLTTDTSAEWISNGGTTLASEIYKLTKLEVIPWDYVKSVGIVIMFFIISISVISHLLKNEKNIEFSIFSISFLLIIFSILFAIYWLFIVGIIFYCLSLFLSLIYNFINNKINLNQKITNLYNLFIDFIFGLVR